MLKLKITKGKKTAELSMYVADGNEKAVAVVDGDLDWELRQYLNNEAFGAFGHTINTRSTTAIDIHYALSQSQYEFEVLEGAELVEKYDPGIPPDAKT